MYLFMVLGLPAVWSQDCFPPNTPRSLYDYGAYLDIQHYFIPQGDDDIEMFTVDLQEDLLNILTKRVDYTFRSNNPDAKGPTFVDFGDGIHTWEPVQWNQPMSITYSDYEPRTISFFKPEHDPNEPVASFQISFVPQGKGAEYEYQFPDVTWLVQTEESYNPSGCSPPDGGEYGWGGGPAKGLAYIRYGQGNEGILRKPILFIEGIDFSFGGTINPDEDEQSPGHRTQLGSVGWDIMTTGVGRSKGSDYSEFAEYPRILQDLHDDGYDIIYLDFVDGATYIQRNSLLVQELIRRVNNEKALNGITTPNVVIGASMGGLVARHALTSMENAGENHCTGTFVSFDSPQQGAHLPLGIQSAAWFLWATDNFADLWLAMNRPATHQLLIQHFGQAFADGLIEIEPWASSGEEITYNPIPPDGDYACLRTAFQAEMNALGYPRLTRNIGIACGSHLGTFQNELNQGAGIIDAEIQAIKGGDTWGPVVIFDANAANGSPGPDTKLVRKVNNDCNIVNKTSTSLPDILFTSAIPSKLIHCSLLGWGGAAPNEYDGAWVRRTGDILALDHVPGAYRNDLKTMTDLINQILACNDISFPIIYKHPTRENLAFIPTASALDLQVPFSDESWSASFTQSQLANLTRFDKVWASDENLKHVALNQLMADWLKVELQSFDQSVLELPQAAGPEYNFGNKLRTIPRSVVHNGGIMYVNDAGKLEFRNGIPSYNEIHEAWTKSCNADITVENGGALILGEDKTDNVVRKAWVHIVAGTTVHIQSGGTLRLAQGSRLLVEEGARLIIDADAMVDLRTDQDRIEVYGTLEVGGAFDFPGLGYFEFHPTHHLELTGGLFSLTGTAKDHRFIRLADQTTLHLGSNLLELADGRVDYGAHTRIVMEAGGRADLTGVTLALFPATINFTGVTGLKVENPKWITFRDCDILGLQMGVDAAVPSGQTGYIPIKDFFTFSSCQFLGCETGIRAANIKGMELTDCLFDALGVNAIPFVLPGRYGVHLTDMQAAWLRGSTFQHYLDPSRIDLPTEDMAAIYIRNVQQLRAYNSTVDENTLGILSPLNSRSNVFLYAGSTISNNEIGVWMRTGGIDPQGLDYGIVLMDCSHLINNRYGIKGWDVLLQIDALMNAGNQQGIVAPNTFEIGPDGERLFDICYLYRYNIQTVFARGNYWNPLPVASDWHLYNTGGQGSTCGDQPSNVVLDIDQPITDQTLLGRYCPGDPRDPESDDEPADPAGCLTCIIVNPADVACTSWPESGVTGTVGDVFHHAWQEWYVEDYSAAMDGFTQLSQGSDAWRDGLDARCGHYVDVARVFAPKSAGQGMARQNTTGSNRPITDNGSPAWKLIPDTEPSIGNPVLAPNPSNGRVYLRWTGIGAEARMTVADLTGKVWFAEWVSPNTELDLHHLPEGAYVVTLRERDGDRMFTQMLIKQ